MGELAKLHSDLEALVGKLIHDRYRVDSLLGVGGMGAVFKGYHTGLKREVAIKLLHPEIGRDESISKRFDREAYSASRLDHPNCVRVSDFGTTETGAKYLVMEFLEGAELEASLGKPWAPLEAVRVAKQMFSGLEHAHHFGVVHRDLKPENVFVTTDYRGQQVVKLVDFGIAKLLDGEGAQEKLTRAGLVFGTPRYMSPEQAAGGKIDERTDLYAAGLIVYEMLAGHAPFDADEPGQLLRMQIMAPPPALPSSVPAGLVALVGKLLEKSKSDRCASAREVIDALELLERELVAAPAVAAPVVVPLPVSPEGPTARKTNWQPVEPTTSLPAPPPPAALETRPIAAPLEPPMAPTLPPGPAIATATATAPMPVSNSPSGTMPMAIAPGPLPVASPSGSYPSTSNASTTASQTWATSSSALSAVSVASAPTMSSSRERETTPMLPWMIAGAALLIAALAFGALMTTRDGEAADDPSSLDESGGIANPADVAGAIPDPATQPGVADPAASQDPPRAPTEPEPEPEPEPSTPKSKPTPKPAPVPKKDESRKPAPSEPDTNVVVIDEDDIEDAIHDLIDGGEESVPDPTGKKPKGKDKGKGHDKKHD
ncbi:serine/threonine-protein kinase [Nannocystaceae bacterium ST9]